MTQGHPPGDSTTYCVWPFCINQHLKECLTDTAPGQSNLGNSSLEVSFSQECVKLPAEANYDTMYGKILVYPGFGII